MARTKGNVIKNMAGGVKRSADGMEVFVFLNF